MEQLNEILAIAARTRRDYLRLLDLVAQLEWRESGHRSLAGFLAALLRVTPRKARQLVEHAELVATTSIVTGKPTKPRLPVVRRAMAGGAASADHLTAIARTMGSIPDEWIAARRHAEKTLAAATHVEGPHALYRIGAEILARLNLVRDVKPAHSAARRPNKLRYQVRGDGTLIGQFELSSQAAVLLPVALDRVIADREAGSEPDPRLPAERLGDALATLIATVSSQADRQPMAVGAQRTRSRRSTRTSARSSGGRRSGRRRVNVGRLHRQPDASGNPTSLKENGHQPNKHDQPTGASTL